MGGVDLKKFQKLLVEKQDEVIAAIVADTGKPAQEALGIEIMAVLMTADYYRKNAGRILKPRRAKTHWIFKNKSVLVERVPHGTVGIIGPSNLPFVLTIGDAIPALVTGNKVIIKPSEKTPRSAEVGRKLMREAGLSENDLEITQGGPEVGRELIEKADCIFFTGSMAVGRKIAARCGELLKPCILELGGKAPMIVLEDADIERAARACVWGRFANSGQHCIAVERVYVDQKIEAVFLDEVRRQAKTINIPLKVSQHAQELLEEALAKGARSVRPELVEGQWRGSTSSPRTAGSPTILINTNHSMRVMKEEAFGPLLPIMSFESEEEAIKLANDSESGLSAVVFTRNKEKALAIAKQIESGNVSINDVMDHFMVIDAPMGGWKQSGMGVRHGPEGLLQFTKPRAIFQHRFPLPFCYKKEFWWFPYQKWNYSLLKWLVRIFFG